MVKVPLAGAGRAGSAQARFRGPVGGAGSGQRASVGAVETHSRPSVGATTRVALVLHGGATRGRVGQARGRVGQARGHAPTWGGARGREQHQIESEANIMPYDPKKHHRRSIRLKEYDYTSPGAYFVTICTQGHICIFGDVVDGEIVLNAAGRMVQAVWESIPERFPTIQSDVYVIMPNHFHAIIVITDAHRRGDPRGRPGAGTRHAPIGAGTRHAPIGASTRHAPTGATGATRRPALGNVVGAFKSITTHEYIVGVRNREWPPFNRRLWQRNYWEHIIRNETSYQRIYRYVESNPACWENDQLHPDAPPNPFNRG
jgi:putative transposase